MLILACIGGLGGALLMILPDLLARILDSRTSYAPFGVQDFAWPAAAFAIAAATTALYCFLLDSEAHSGPRA